MKTLYLKCSMGAAGDMLMSALLELHENPAEFLKRLNSAALPVGFDNELSKDCGEMQPSPELRP